MLFWYGTFEALPCCQFLQTQVLEILNQLLSSTNLAHLSSTMSNFTSRWYLATIALRCDARDLPVSCQFACLSSATQKVLYVSTEV